MFWVSISWSVSCLSRRSKGSKEAEAEVRSVLGCVCVDDALRHIAMNYSVCAKPFCSSNLCPRLQQTRSRSLPQRSAVDEQNLSSECLFVYGRLD